MPRSPACKALRRLGTGLAVALVWAAAAQAVPDWRKDGRPGYATRDQATSLAQAFTAPRAPRAGMSYTIVHDPDGGFTPVFHLPPRDSQGS